MAKKLTISTINRGWPHQVALLVDSARDSLVAEQANFCARLLRCSEILPVTHEGQIYNVHCFATKAGASAFMERFGGIWFDSGERGRGPDADQWLRKATTTPA